MKLNEYFFDPPHMIGRLPPLVFPNGRLDERQLAARDGVIKFNGDRFVHKTTHPLFNLSSGMKTHVAHASLWEYVKGKTYVFGREFLDTLLKTEIKEGIFNLFPETDWTGYIALPRDLLLYQNNKMPALVPIIGAYVSIRSVKHMYASGHNCRDLPHLFNSDRYLWYTALSDLGESRHGTLNGYLALSKDFTSLEDMVVSNVSARDVTSNNELINIINAAMILMALYIHTAQPDLRTVKPASQLSPSQIKGLINKGKANDVENDYSNDTVLPVELVSWGWKKPDLYSKEQWGVPARIVGYWTGEGRTKRISRWLPPTVAHRNPDLLNKGEKDV